MKGGFTFIYNVVLGYLHVLSGSKNKQTDCTFKWNQDSKCVHSVYSTLLRTPTLNVDWIFHTWFWNASTKFCFLNEPKVTLVYRLHKLWYRRRVHLHLIFIKTPRNDVTIFPPLIRATRRCHWRSVTPTWWRRFSNASFHQNLNGVFINYRPTMPNWRT